MVSYTSNSPNYIIGKTLKESTISEDKILSLSTGDITLKVVESVVFLTDSLPTGDTNYTFPENALRDNTILNYNVPP